MKPDKIEEEVPIFTQEKSIELSDKVLDLNKEIHMIKEENKKLIDKLDVALEMLTKEQLIEFIYKTM